MRTKHDSDAAFETWVTSGDGEHLLRTHTVQAAFREGWNAGREQSQKPVRRKLETLAAIARAIGNDANTLESALMRFGITETPSGS